MKFTESEIVELKKLYIGTQRSNRFFERYAE
jgi:hypothetical protein